MDVFTMKHAQAKWIVAAVAAQALLALSARADSPKSTPTPNSGAESNAARRRAQLAAPVLSATVALAALKKSADNRVEAQWIQLDSDAGGFVASFPAPPTKHSVRSDAGSELGSGMTYELVLAPDQVYVAGSAEIRGLKSDVDATLANAMQGVAEGLHGTLKDVVRRNSGLLATIDGRITLRTGAVVVVMFIAGSDRMYALAAGDGSGNGTEDVDRFFRSFAAIRSPVGSAGPAADEITAEPTEYAQLTADAIPNDWADLPPAAIDFGLPAITGSLKTVVVTRYLKRNKEKFRYCYQKELETSPRISGTVTAAFSIAADGSVSSSNAEGINPVVAGCIADAVRGIGFPKTSTGGTVKYPLKLRPMPRK